MANSLKKLRREIDQIDKKLLKTLAGRFKITQKVGEYKKKNSLPSIDREREKELFKKCDYLAQKLNLNKKLVKEIFQAILKIVRANHKKIKTKN